MRNRVSFFSVYRSSTFLIDGIIEAIRDSFDVVSITNLQLTKLPSVQKLGFEKIDRISSFYTFASNVDSEVDYHILCDDDVMLTKNSLKKDIEFLNLNKSILAMQPSHLPVSHCNYQGLYHSELNDINYRTISSVEIGPFLIIRAGTLSKLFPICLSDLGFGLEKYWTLFPNNCFAISYNSQIYHVKPTTPLKNVSKDSQRQNNLMNMLINRRICELI
jgi:hypothetical protein